MRAAIDSDREPDLVGAAQRAFAAGAEEVVVTCAERVLDEATLVALRALGRVRLRVTLARLGENVRGVARGCSAGLSVDVILPIGEGLRPAAGRLHGLARATPRVTRYLLSPVPEGVPPLAPAAIEIEIAEAREAATELSVALSLDDDTRIDTELQAVLGGIKPAIRLSTEGTDEDTLRARYARYGLVACAGDGAFIDDKGENGRRLRLVYVARSLETAEHVRAVEAKTFAPQRDVESRAAEYREVGLALGYPPCCVDAYVARMLPAPLAPSGVPLAEAFVAARGAWHASPSWLLNHLLFETGDALITFTPCSYRCAAALEYATKVIARVDGVAPLAARRLRRRLAVDVAVDAHGARVVAELEAGSVRAAHPRRSPRGSHVHPADLDLARRLVDGVAEDPAPIVVLFGTAGQRAEP